MKVFYLIFVLFVLSVSDYAQTKFGFINVKALSMENTGITELILAKQYVNSIETNCDILCGSLYLEYEKLGKKLLEHGKSRASMKRILERRTILKKRLDSLRGERVVMRKNLRTSVYSPINLRILEKLWNFRFLHGLKEIFSRQEGKIEFPFGGPTKLDPLSLIDVTEEFIKYCNEEFEKEKAQKR